MWQVAGTRSREDSEASEKVQAWVIGKRNLCYSELPVPAVQSSAVTLISLLTNCCYSYTTGYSLLWVLKRLAILYTPYFIFRLKTEPKTRPFFSDMDELVIFLFKKKIIYLLITGIWSAVNEGRMLRHTDGLCALWISGLLPSGCLEILPTPISSPSHSISCLFCGARLPWEADFTNTK